MTHHAIQRASDAIDFTPELGSLKYPLYRRGCYGNYRPTELMTMWTIADRVVKAVSDVTVGTVIVLVHVALADRSKHRKQLAPVAPKN